MAIVSRCLTNSLGLLHPRLYKLPSSSWGCCDIRFNGCNSMQLVSSKAAGERIISAKLSSNKNIVSAGRERYNLRYEDDLPQEPFWLSILREAIWALKSLFEFLLDQPSQLRYLEWPSFHSTLKTACLTLVIVALLIVALSSVDSVLCYLLALAMKRTR